MASRAPSSSGIGAVFAVIPQQAEVDGVAGLQVQIFAQVFVDEDEVLPLAFGHQGTEEGDLAVERAYSASGAFGQENPGHLVRHIDVLAPPVGAQVVQLAGEGDGGIHSVITVEFPFGRPG